MLPLSITTLRSKQIENSEGERLESHNFRISHYYLKEAEIYYFWPLFNLFHLILNISRIYSRNQN